MSDIMTQLKQVIKAADRNGNHVLDLEELQEAGYLWGQKRSGDWLPPSFSYIKSAVIRAGMKLPEDLDGEAFGNRAAEAEAFTVYDEFRSGFYNAKADKKAGVVRDHH